MFFMNISNDMQLNRYYLSISNEKKRVIFEKKKVASRH